MHFRKKKYLQTYMYVICIYFMVISCLRTKDNLSFIFVNWFCEYFLSSKGTFKHRFYLFAFLRLDIC